ncbi:hypothetical protein FRC10_009006 [Ceratobasidium sp. 414]|nr:hypothetical protein FRC10_009006 [Ceratobasidium sp. 414]
MPSLLQRSASQHDKKNKKFGSVSGPASPHADDDARQTVTQPAFFDPDPDTPRPEMHAEPDEALEEMVVDATNVVPNGAAETAHDDGPWSISVADAHGTKPDKKKFTIYIQTPTQHITLTRSAQEVTDLHAKLRSNHPSTALPPLPGFPASGSDNAENNAKRRSSFLNTLSRLANPSPKLPKPNRMSSLNATINASTPMISPQNLPSEDPFTTLAQAQPSVSQPSGIAPAIPGDDGPTEQTMPALAAYLTLVGNHPVFRHSRAWRRFVRVRTDDLESVRAERVVKRVRSESGLGRNGGSASNLGRASHDVRAGEGVPGVPALPVFGSLDASMRASVSDGESFAPSEGIAEEDEDGTAEGADPTATAVDKDLPLLPAPNERTPSNKHAVLPYADASAQNGSLIPPVSAILASPSMQQAIATPLPPTTPEPQTPPRKDVPLANLGSTTPTAQGQTLPTPGATPTASPPRDKAPVEHRLSSGTDGTDNDNDMFGGFNNDTENEGEFGAETDVEKVVDDGEPSTGVKKLKKKKEKKAAKKVVVDDFEMMRVLGKGCAGKVLLVRHRASTELYALKAITKRHVLAHQELQHTLTEQAVLKRMARESRDPFVVKLWWSFHDKENLFLVMDFHPGGDLATQLARWGRLGRDRARFYAAEIVEGCEGLHAAGVIYRDLKPENILIGADGHIVLTDFGLSKEFPRKYVGTSPTAPPTPNGQTGFVTPHWMDAAGSPGRAPTSKRLDRDMTTTFCGTAEYLAPEVIQGLPYSYEVDWWSFGTMLYEMLTGITPFWANNHSDMYVRVLQDELQFPDDKAMDQDTKSLIRGLLQRNPALRMCEPRVKKHPYFSMIDWQHVYYKRYIPPYIPPIDPGNASDTQNFDEAFLDMEPVIADDPDPTDSERERTDDESDSESARTASGGKSPERPAEPEEETVDVFDGYSFKGRHSVIIDDEDDDGHEGSDEDEDEAEDSRIRDAEVLEPSATSGPITGDQDFATPHHAPADLPPAESEVSTEVESSAPSVAPSTPGPIEPALPEPTTPTAPVAEIPLPEEIRTTPVAPPSPKLSELPPLPAEKPGELAEPTVSPVIAPAVATAAASTATQPPRTKQKREKSGIPALDRAIEDTEEDDWDLIEKPNGEEAAAYNGRTGAGGKQGNSLFARGVVDRYRLAVFSRKQSQSGLSRAARAAPHAVDTGVTPDQAGLASPTNSDTKRRGRSGGLNIRKSTRQFLRARSPPATFSANSSASSRVQVGTMSSTISGATGRTAVNNGSGLLSPALSMPGAMAPSLKSKSSALSGVGPNSPGSSDPSITETPGVVQSQSVGDLVGAAGSTDPGDGTETLRRQSLTSSKMPGSPTDGKKGKKGKKSGTGRVLSLFTIDTKR